MRINRYPDHKPRSSDNLASAKKCADRIKKYWASQGHDVTVKLIPKPHKAGTIYEIHTQGIPGAKA